MDFNLNDEQELFVAGIRELMASENWEAYFAECDRDSVYPERFVKALADMGIDSLLIPEEHGGLDAGFVTLAAVWMELGRLGAPTYVLYQLPGGFNTFLREGTQEQIDKIMAFRGTGKQMWNSAITEPGAGSDVGSLKTTYTRRNGKIYLNGSKCFITSSAYTPYIVVMARDGASPDKPVYTEWFVDMSKPGIKVTKLEKLGLTSNYNSICNQSIHCCIQSIDCHEHIRFVSDRYEILSKVGAGGMSDVYKAKDHILSRFVAIKVLKQEFSEDSSFVTKFRAEAQSAAGLEHPNIVNIYDVGSENGLYYIVMEYVEGITLKTYIEKKGQLSFKESASIAIQVARGIEAAHNKNIIHRDIKPQNIIISTDGKVKVTDFGIAKATSSNTISSDVMGSVHYASPEQAHTNH